MRTANNWSEARVHALRDVTPTVREITLKQRFAGRAGNGRRTSYLRLPPW